MTEKESNKMSISEVINIAKEFLAMSRDAILLLVIVLLLLFPKTINGILVDAGFKKANIAGMEWEANFSKSDESLIKSQSTIADLVAQNDKLNKALSEIKPQINNVDINANIVSLEKINAQIVENATNVQRSAEANILANASLVQEIQTSKNKSVTWGVVYGGDKNIDKAKHEIDVTAPRYGLTNAAIYYRQGSYRSVATTIDRLQASQLLNKVKEYRKDAYIVNMSIWCPNITQKDSYFECSSSS